MDFPWLVGHIRDILDDPANVEFPEDQLWSDGDIHSYLESAQNQFVLLTRVLRTARLSPLTRFALVADRSEYPLNKKIIHIEAAVLDGQRCPIKVTNLSELEEKDPNWRNRTAARPTHLIADYDPDYVWFYPTPTQAGLVLTTVEHYPIKSVVDFQCLEIKSDYWLTLVNWVLYKAYRKQDVDTFDEAKSDSYRTLFEADVDETIQGLRRLKHKTRVIRYVG